MKRLVNVGLMLLFCVFASHASAGARHSILAHSLIVKNKYMVTVTSAVTQSKNLDHKASHWTVKRRSKAIDSHFPGICQSPVRLLTVAVQEHRITIKRSFVNRFFPVPDSRGPPALR